MSDGFLSSETSWHINTHCSYMHTMLWLTMNEFAKWRLVCIIISAWKLKHVPIIFNFILIKCFSSFSTVRYFLNYIPLRICIETTTPQGKEFTAVQKEIIIWYNLRDNTSTKQRLFELHNSGMTIMNNRTVQNLFEKGARERKKTKNEMEVKKTHNTTGW